MTALICRATICRIGAAAIKIMTKRRNATLRIKCVRGRKAKNILDEAHTHKQSGPIKAFETYIFYGLVLAIILDIADTVHLRV